MAHRLDGVLAGIVTAATVSSVGATSKPAGLTAHRMRTRPIESEELDSGPVLVVWWGGDDPVIYDAARRAQRTAHVWVEIRTKQSGSTPDAAVMPLLAWVVKAVLADITLGGASLDIDEGRSVPDLQERDDGLCSAGVEFIVKYLTAFNDPETA